MKTTARVLILETIKREGVFLAVHEFHIRGYSENCLATRVSEMAKDGVLIGRYRIGENWKEWGLAEWVDTFHQDASKANKNPLLTPPVPIPVVWGADGQSDWIQEAMG